MAYEPSRITCHYDIVIPNAESREWTTTDLPPGGKPYDVFANGALYYKATPIDIPYRNITMTDGEYTVVLTFSGGRVIGYQIEESP